MEMRIRLKYHSNSRIARELSENGRFVTIAEKKILTKKILTKRMLIMKRLMKNSVQRN